MGGNLLNVQSLILMSYFCFFSKTFLGWLRVVLWQKFKEFLKIYAWRSVYILLFEPLKH